MTCNVSMVTLNPIVLTHSYFLGSVSFPSLLQKLPSITAEERNDSAVNSGSAVARHFAIHNSLQGVAKLMTHSRTHALTRGGRDDDVIRRGTCLQNTSCVHTSWLRQLIDDARDRPVVCVGVGERIRGAARR